MGVRRTGGHYVIRIMPLVTKTLWAVAVAAVSAIVTLWASGGGALVGPHKGLAPMSVEISFMDFISVLLTVLTIVLAALAIGIAFVAFRTIKEIKEDARRIATDTATATMTELTKGLPGQVETTVDAFVKKELPPAIKENVISAIEEYAKSGELGKLLERAYIKLSTIDPETAKELAEETDQSKQKEEKDGKS